MYPPNPNPAVCVPVPDVSLKDTGYVPPDDQEEPLYSSVVFVNVVGGYDTNPPKATAAV